MRNHENKKNNRTESEAILLPNTIYYFMFFVFLFSTAWMDIRILRL